jgi:hypothetical protein
MYHEQRISLYEGARRFIEGAAYVAGALAPALAVKTLTYLVMRGNNFTDKSFLEEPISWALGAVLPVGASVDLRIGHAPNLFHITGCLAEDFVRENITRRNRR